jgi:hypothetical protein
MGLRTASAIFCRYIDQIVGSFKWQCLVGYVDDIFIWSPTVDRHIDDVLSVLTRLHEHNITLGAKKCSLFRPKAVFIGHLIDSEGIAPDPKKVKAITDIPRPECSSDLVTQVGMFGYYRKFVKNYSTVAHPLREKMALPFKKDKNGNAIWTKAEDEAWSILKQAIISNTLQHADHTKPFTLYCDACTLGLGAALTQDYGGVERAVAFSSRSLSKRERSYAHWEREALSCVWATHHFRMYILCVRFTLVTDSQAVKSILGADFSDRQGRLMRWGLLLSQYDYEIRHRAGKQQRGRRAAQRHQRRHHHRSAGTGHRVAVSRSDGLRVPDDCQSFQSGQHRRRRHLDD